jgi:3-oxoacyl-[acyl-carrier-protein] synthase-3
MRYQHACLESLAYTLPGEIVTSSQIEEQLGPLYERLRLPAGRLELMTGIRERRLWPPGTLPSEVSIVSGQRLLRAAGIDRSEIGALIHASVCRDHLEPATACRVHHALGLPQQCMIYDVSNACLGILNGIVQVANMIELGQIRAGLIVGSEGSRGLLETTIAELNRNTSLTRNDIKLAVASLTIGSASCAVLVTHRAISKSNHRVVAAVARAHTDHHQLCHSGSDEAGGSTQPLMTTDSERLMAEGIATGVATFRDFLAETGWLREEVQRTFCHQVGSTHRKLMLESLGLPLDNDYATLEWLGNTGSAALPTTMAIGVEKGFLQPGQKVGMLGIGSGINSVMVGVEW